MIKKLSTKRALITKANTTVVFLIASASFVAVFSLVGSKALLERRAYQSRVIGDKEKAVKQLRSNLQAVASLNASYKQFVGTSTNVLGGNPAGQADKDGDNAKIVLDALPSKYDFPALATSLEKIYTENNYKIDSITGNDDEINQANATSPNPVPVDMPFTLSLSSNYAGLQSVFGLLERSIRPFQVESLQVTAGDTAVHVTVKAKTFYQPEKNLTISTKEIK